MAIGKVIVALVIALAAWLIGSALRDGECQGGMVIADMATCQASGRGVQACVALLDEAEKVARRSGQNFPTRFACNDRFLNCIERSDIVGWSAKPTSYCVRGASDGRLDITPIYSTRP